MGAFVSRPALRAKRPCNALSALRPLFPGVTFGAIRSALSAITLVALWSLGTARALLSFRSGGTDWTFWPRHRTGFASRPRTSLSAL